MKDFTHYLSYCIKLNQNETIKFLDHICEKYNFDKIDLTKKNYKKILDLYRKINQEIRYPFLYFWVENNFDTVYLIPRYKYQNKVYKAIEFKLSDEDDIVERMNEFDLNESRHLCYLLEEIGINPTNRFKWYYLL